MSDPAADISAAPPPPLASTPEPPYYAVIFSSVRNEGDQGYAETADRMERLAAASPGFLGMDSARNAAEGGAGITVCYWENLQAIRDWKRHVEHEEAQRLGRERWYRSFRVRIARVEREYGAAAGADSARERD